ncbi:MAG: ATP-binding cassette domain-containing protein, partial [Burkholderiaceae bacterium]
TDRLKDISLSVRAGEIVGLGGLDGQGQRDLLLALFGVLRGCSGNVLIDGAPVKINSPTTAKSEKIGMALIPEDRKTEGLMLPMTVRDNLSFASLHRISDNGIVNRAKEQKYIDEMISLLAIKTAGTDIPVGSLSGGNQQKVVIAKWLFRESRVIFFDEPTRGIDVGAKFAIYELMDRLAAQGIGIVLISSELPEILGLTDRVAVFHNGRITRVLDTRATSQQEIMHHASVRHADAAPITAPTLIPVAP